MAEFDPSSLGAVPVEDKFDPTSLGAVAVEDKPAERPAYVGTGEFASDSGASSAPILENAVNDPLAVRADAFLRGAGIPTSKQGLKDTLNFIFRSPVQDVKDIASGLSEIPSKLSNLGQTLSTSPAATVARDPNSPESFGVYGTAAGLLLPKVLDVLGPKPVPESISSADVAPPITPEELQRTIAATETPTAGGPDASSIQSGVQIPQRDQGAPVGESPPLRQLDQRVAGTQETQAGISSEQTPTAEAPITAKVSQEAQPGAVGEVSKIVLEPPNSVLAKLTFGDENKVSEVPDFTSRTTARGKKYDFALSEYDLPDGRKRFTLSAGGNLVDAAAIVRLTQSGPEIQMLHGGETGFNSLGAAIVKEIAKRYGKPIISENSPLSGVTEKFRNKLGIPESVPASSEVLLPSKPTGITESLAELDRRNGRAAQLPTPENKGLGLPEPAPSEPLTPEQAAQPEAIKGGVVPAEKVVSSSDSPATAAEISPQALGVTHPLPAFLQSGVDYFTKNTPSQIWNSVKGSLDATLGKTFAKTTIADRPSGELAARWISSRIAAPHLADTFSTNVLADTGIDPVKFGAALTEDNLRSIRKGFEAEGKPDEAGNVTTIIGSKNSPFKTEAEFQSFLKDPATQQAIERHRALWGEVVDPMYRDAQRIEPGEPLPSRGDSTGARVNLYNDVEGKGKSVVGGTGAGNLSATLRKKSPFATQAKGTGQSYNVNYNDMMANTFGRQLEIANKNAFENRLVETGNAVIEKPGQNVTLPDGDATKAFPLKRTVLITAEDGSKIPVNQNIYVRKSLAGEYRRGADVDLINVPGAVKGFNNAVNRAALAGLTDASVHVLNQATALFTRPGVAGGVLMDSLLSTFGRADIPVTLTKALVKAVQDNREQMSQLAEIGAAKESHQTINPLGKLIQGADKTTRLVLDDAFKNMAESGLVENTETNRREFVNQVGQYNKKAQGDLRRLARDSGFGPFATAGTTFNTLGLRTITGSPGITATSPMAAAALRANVLSKWIGGLVFAGSLNYLLTKDKGGGVFGRPGVPIGKIDTGTNDKNGRPLSIPYFDIIGLGRAMRVTGARGFIEAKRKGLTTGDAIDAAGTDIANTSISPFAGPAIRFGGVALAGKPLTAINVPRVSKVVPPGESQIKENVKQALVDANPIIKSAALANEPGEGIGSAIRQQIPRLDLQPSPNAEFASKYPQIVRKAQAREFTNDLIRRARKMNPEDQDSFVASELKKLQPEDRKQAERVVKYSHINYRSRERR